MLNTKTTCFLTYLFVLFLLASNSFAQNANDIKNRMKERLPAINALKASGVIGEKIDGYLGYVNQGANIDKIVTDENNDRKTVYTAIARQQGTTTELVGQRRALQIYEIAEPGTYLQDSSGNWHKK